MNDTQLIPLPPGWLITEPVVWICGQYRASHSPTATAWDFQGVFTHKAAAERACRSLAYFIFPIKMNEALPHAPLACPGVEWPRHPKAGDPSDQIPPAAIPPVQVPAVLSGLETKGSAWTYICGNCYRRVLTNYTLALTECDRCGGTLVKAERCEKCHTLTTKPERGPAAITLCAICSEEARR